MDHPIDAVPTKAAPGVSQLSVIDQVRLPTSVSQPCKGMQELAAGQSKTILGILRRPFLECRLLRDIIVLDGNDKRPLGVCRTVPGVAAFVRNQNQSHTFFFSSLFFPNVSAEM